MELWLINLQTNKNQIIYSFTFEMGADDVVHYKASSAIELFRLEY